MTYSKIRDQAEWGTGLRMMDMIHQHLADRVQSIIKVDLVQDQNLHFQVENRLRNP